VKLWTGLNWLRTGSSSRPENGSELPGSIIGGEGFCNMEFVKLLEVHVDLLGGNATWTCR
jgi:hypothetical protein